MPWMRHYRGRNLIFYCICAIMLCVVIYALIATVSFGMKSNSRVVPMYARYDENVQEETKDNSKLVIESLQQQVGEMRKKIDVLENKRKIHNSVKFLTYKDRKRILVTGGAGFVGSHLVDKLMLQGHEVTVMDNFFTGRKRNVEHWIGHPNFELMVTDIVNIMHVEVDEIYHLASPASPPHYMYNPVKTLKTNTIGTINLLLDEIYHLASPASPPHYMYNPVKTLKTNTIGTMNLLSLAKRVKAKFLLASTSEVYGDPEVHPQKEDYWGHVNPIGPRACYDEGKRVAETITYAFAKQDKVPVRVARIFNTFGPRMHMNDGRVVSNFILQALQHQPITIYGDGSQTRSFQYVSDLVHGLVSLMNGNYSLPVNLGNPDEHTIGDFAKIIKTLVGNSKSEITYKPAVQDDPRRRRPDITLAKTVLNWYPKVKMNDGLLKTIKFFRDELTRQAESKEVPHLFSGGV